MATWDRVSQEFAKQNTFVGVPAKVTGAFSILSPEGGNTVIVEPGVWMRGVKIEFKGTGNTITFKADCIPYGKFIAAHGGSIVIGQKTRMNKPCWFQAFEGKSITVGDSCLFADIRVRTSDLHSILSTVTGGRLNPAKDVSIGNGIWIAEKAHIYKGVTIGDGSIVGAHAVVVKNIPPNCLAVGNPARVAKKQVTWKRKLLGPDGDPSTIDPNAMVRTGWRETLMRPFR